MSTRVQRRRGSAAAHATFIGAEGEITVMTDEKRLVVHDGATPGGIPQARKDEVTAEALRQIGNANFSFQVTDRLVTPNAAFTAARTGTLPLASAVAAGRTITFFDALPAINGTNTLTVARSGSDTINGATSYPCATPRGRWEFVSDGVSKWSVAIGLETRLRVDAVQGLTTGEKLQARQNLGISTDGDALATAASAAAQRALLKQKWVDVYDTGPLAAAAVAIAVPVSGGYSRYRIRADLIPNTGVADFQVACRFATDGVPNFITSSSYDYFGSIFGSAGGATPVSLVTNAFGLVSFVVDSASPEFAASLDIDLLQGGAARKARLKSWAESYDGGNHGLTFYETLAKFTGALTHLQLIGTVAGNVFAAGSRVVVEGLA